MTRDTRITLFLLAELVAALRANDPDTFKRWLYGGIDDLGEPAVTELLLDWLDPFITRAERDRIVVWHLKKRCKLLAPTWQKEMGWAS